MKCVFTIPEYRHPATGELLDDERIGQQRFAEPAVLLVDRETEQSHFTHAVDDVGRVLIGVLERLRVRNDLLVHEFANGVQDRDLYVRQSGCLRKAGHRWTSISY